MDGITKKDVSIVKRKLKLTKESKILSISHHGCMDGSGCCISLYNHFKDIHFIKSKFNNVDNTCKYIDYDKYDAVIFTDMSPSSGSLIKDAKNVILLDHHESAKFHHDPDNMRFVYNNDSATILTQKFLTYYTGRDFSYLDELYNHINNYDLWLNPYNKNWHLSLLHYYYLRKDKFEHTKFVKRFCTGDTRFNEEEQAYIDICEKELREKWDHYKKNYHNLPYNIYGCLIVSHSYVNELLDRFRNKMGMKMVINKNPKSNQCSIRCKVKSVHVGNILQELCYGGGHDDAGGFYETDFIKFREKIETFCQYLADNHKELVLKNV